jgi:regulation of enolase protein 1 (concanavalin A-like superfamily)
VALVLGIVALALGALALVISWIPFVGLVGLAGSIPGLALGVVGMVMASGRRRSGMGVALAGAGVSLFAALVAGTVTVLMGVLLRDVDTGPGPRGDGGGERPAQQAATWGDAIDPDRDCKFRQQGGALTIEVPPTPHDLSIDLGRINAPRVMQEVEGDFVARVKVCGTIRPMPPGTIPSRVPFQAGGLLLWRDDRNYLRLERAATNRGGAVHSYASVDTRINAVHGPNPTVPLADRDTYLRLERRGNQLTGSVSRDGRNWTGMPSVSLALPARVRVGVTAINAAAQPLTVRFEEFTVSR